MPLSLSTLADQVAAVCTVMQPIYACIEAQAFAADRLRCDDTTVPVLAKGKTITGRCWVYVRDDRPFGEKTAPAAVFYYSRDRRGEHPQRHLAQWAGIMQADAHTGDDALFQARSGMPAPSPGRRRAYQDSSDCGSCGKRQLFPAHGLAESQPNR